MCEYFSWFGALFYSLIESLDFYIWQVTIQPFNFYAKLLHNRTGKHIISINKEYEAP